MQLVCPSCAASYSVPDALIGTGRNMRCVRCQHDWFATAPVEVPVEVPMPDPVVEAAAEPEAVPAMPIHTLPVKPKAPPRKTGAAPVAAPGGKPSALLILAWVASIGLVAAGGWALWAYRAPLAEFWPPLIRLYTLLGA